MPGEPEVKFGILCEILMFLGVIRSTIAVSIATRQYEMLVPPRLFCSKEASALQRPVFRFPDVPLGGIAMSLRRSGRLPAKLKCVTWCLSQSEKRFFRSKGRSANVSGSQRRSHTKHLPWYSRIPKSERRQHVARRQGAFAGPPLCESLRRRPGVGSFVTPTPKTMDPG